MRGTFRQKKWLVKGLGLEECRNEYSSSFLLEPCASTSPGYDLGVELLCCRICISSIILDIAKLLSQKVIPICATTRSIEVQIVSYLCQHLILSNFLILLCIFSDNWKVEYLFILLLNIQVSSSVTFLFISFAHFSIILVSFLLIFMSPLYILNINPLSNICIINSFSQPETSISIFMMF